MTCKEKLAKEHPEWTEEKIDKHVRFGCPLNYIDRPAYCGVGKDSHCEQCWDREIPEERGCIIGDEKVEHPDTDLPAEPAIKSSGSTTEFDTGAHRDSREGKGRCDLLPLEVVTNFINHDNDYGEAVTWNLMMFQKSLSTRYLYSAIRLFGDVCWNDQFSMFLEVAKHYEEGAKKYGENNWKNGMPVHIYIDSAIRHYLKWLRGDKDEPHDRAFVWNLMCCIWEVDYHKKSEKED